MKKCRMEADRPAICRARKPRASLLRRAVEENVLERFLECGICTAASCAPLPA